MRLYLVRHPRPQIDAGFCYGSSDLSVNSDEQAKVLADLVPQLPKTAPIFSSPLQRCSVFAQHLSEAFGSELITHDARLAEMHFGAWELCEWETISRQEIDAWTQDLICYRPGGGENVLQVAQRVCAFYHDVRRQEHDEAIVVCHAGTIRLLMAAQHHDSVEDIARAAAQTQHRIGYGALIIIDC